MKKLNFIFLLSLCFSGNLFSQYADENFEYAAGDSLQQHNWITIGNVFTNRMLVTSPGLSFPSYINSGLGNAVTVDTTGQDIYRDFTSPVNSGNIYASFLVKVKTAKATGDYFVSLLSSTSTTSLAGRVFAKDSSGNIAFGISKTTEAVSYTNARYFKDTTYLIILKYSVNSGTANDSVSLFIYSQSAQVPSFEPLPDIGPKGGSGSDLTDAGRFCLRQGIASSSPRVILDGIYITNSWDNSALPVELSSFYFQTVNRDVLLHWTTAAESNNSGFEIQRAEMDKGISEDWLITGTVTGAGTSGVPVDYYFSDRNLSSGIYKYRLRQYDFNGNSEYFYLMNEVKIEYPEKYILHQNFPNPFNPETNIEYEIPSESKVNLKIFDVSGKEIALLTNNTQKAGYYNVNFNASELPSGIYFAVLTVENSINKLVLNKKLTLIK